jgi:hypothetical protein
MQTEKTTIEQAIAAAIAERYAEYQEHDPDIAESASIADVVVDAAIAAASEMGIELNDRSIDAIHETMGTAYEMAKGE